MRNDVIMISYELAAISLFLKPVINARYE